jgi:hypothetical protein
MFNISTLIKLQVCSVIDASRFLLFPKWSFGRRLSRFSSVVGGDLVSGRHSISADRIKPVSRIRPGSTQLAIARDRHCGRFYRDTPSFIRCQGAPSATLSINSAIVRRMSNFAATLAMTEKQFISRFPMIIHTCGFYSRRLPL